MSPDIQASEASHARRLAEAIEAALHPFSDTLLRDGTDTLEVGELRLSCRPECLAGDEALGAEIARILVPLLSLPRRRR